MVFIKSALVFTVIFLASVSASPTFWKGNSLLTSIEEMRSLCAGDDPISCLKLKALSFLDSILKKDYFQISDDVEVKKNGYRSNEVSGRSESTLEDTVAEYIKSHDVTFKLPIEDSAVTLDARNLDSDQLSLKLNFNSGRSVEARKSKLKKIFIPILVFVLLKAMTLIPLALGVLGLKAWNALQLSFFSFVVSVALAVFQLCKKIASDGAHPQIVAHPPIDAGWAGKRSFDASKDAAAQEIAYAGYKQE